MYPELLHIGSVTIHSFGVMMALAFLTAGAITHWRLRTMGEDPEIVYSLLIGAIIGGIVGAKVHYLILHPDQFRVASFSGSGLVWYGGLFGGFVGVYLVAHFMHAPKAALADAIAPGLALAYSVGRIGCFLNGDDYGHPTSLPWGIAFPKGSPPTTVPVHPTQLYEVLASGVIFILLVWVISPRMRRIGGLMWAYMILAGIERFLVEFVRTNRPVLLGLTQQQWISIGLVVAGAMGVWWTEFKVRDDVAKNGAANPASVRGRRTPPKKASPGAAVRGKQSRPR
ncbi:MAG: prolipoprotein diacylglyceryl transferase [Actinobacteria bacterium]|nr:prolipoprotein diacylglyceryl transferase [Actinomycetota bacterium]